MKISVVIGANYGDEGKGLTTFQLAKNDFHNYDQVFNILYNGGQQRGHTANGYVWHCFGSGSEYANTLYWPTFLVNPVAIMNEYNNLMIKGKRVNTLIIDDYCRVTLPHDVMLNRLKENFKRRLNEHNGSCGMGIWETIKRSEKYPLYYKVLCNYIHENDINGLYKMIKILEEGYYKEQLKCFSNEDKRYFYENLNLEDFFLASKDLDELAVKCNTKYYLNNLVGKNSLIFEGSQGLLLSDQNTTISKKYLTPSSTGLNYISDFINTNYSNFQIPPEIYYVTRCYMTRHGKGPMEQECLKDDLNSKIKDNTNIYNTFQENLRYGTIYVPSLLKRINEDFSLINNTVYINKPKKSLVITHLNYSPSPKEGVIYSSLNNNCNIGFSNLKKEGKFDNIYGSYNPNEFIKL